MTQSLQFIHFGFIHTIHPNIILLNVEFDGTFLSLIKLVHIFLLLLLNQSHLNIFLPLFDNLCFQAEFSSVHLCLLVLSLIQVIRPFIKIHFPTSLLQCKGLSLTLMCQYRSGHLHFFSKFKPVKLRLLTTMAYFFPNGSVVLKFAVIESSTAFQLSILLPKYAQSLEKMLTMLLVFNESSHGLFEGLRVLILSNFSLMLNLEVAQVSPLRSRLSEVHKTLSDVIHHFIDLQQTNAMIM